MRSLVVGESGARGSRRASLGTSRRASLQAAGVKGGAGVIAARRGEVVECALGVRSRALERTNQAGHKTDALTMSASQPGRQSSRQAGSKALKLRASSTRSPARLLLTSMLMPAARRVFCSRLLGVPVGRLASWLEGYLRASVASPCLRATKTQTKLNATQRKWSQPARAGFIASRARRVGGVSLGEITFASMRRAAAARAQRSRVCACANQQPANKLSLLLRA